MDEPLQVLIADDDPVTRRLLEHTLAGAGYQTIVCETGDQAMHQLGPHLAVALLDLSMPGKTGQECLDYVQQHCPEVAVIVVTSNSEAKQAVAALKHGAFEYLVKPIDRDDLLAHVQAASRAGSLARENQQLRQAVSGPAPTARLIGRSTLHQELIAKVKRVATADATVLLTGESGTGKTTLARWIHQTSPRAGGPFVLVSCAAIPSDLLESELFGHVRGAFTGAVRDRPGRAELAHQGTLFLDEVGDLPLELQPKLLNFLQDRMVRRVGGSTEKRVDVRVIAATHWDLTKKLLDRSFREDLYFRLNVLPITAAPLRDRPEDILLIAEDYLTSMAQRRRTPPMRLAPAAKEALLLHAWPGNIRELENVLERACAYADGAVLTPADLSLPTVVPAVAGPQPTLAGKTLREIETQAIQETLARCQGNKKAAAKMLGIDEKSIYNKMKRLGLWRE